MAMADPPASASGQLGRVYSAEEIIAVFGQIERMSEEDLRTLADGSERTSGGAGDEAPGGGRFVDRSSSGDAPGGGRIVEEDDEEEEEEAPGGGRFVEPSSSSEAPGGRRFVERDSSSEDEGRGSLGV